MSQPAQTQSCDLERIEAYLSGDLQGVRRAEFIAHLNDCHVCRRELEQRAAEPECWREARELLRPETSPSSSDADHDPAFPCLTRLPLPIQQVLDALAPSDDPAMLGRLGSYEISSVVGSGGMGVVLKAIDKSLDRIVAIKVLAPHLAASGAATKRFAREAKAAAAVLHPNVIAIHGVANDRLLPYLVMPYVRGTSLQKRINEHGPLSATEILRIGAQIAAGLAAAHAQGLVHRDIKPANILLEEGVERVAITDFGLARAMDDASITHSGLVVGTPQYMSPEQARGEPVDGRSDLFSLGSVLYAMCTGRPPFRAETTYGVIRRIIDDEPPAVRGINPEIPDWLEAFVRRLMAKRAEDRFPSAAQVTSLLEASLAHVQQPLAVSLPESIQPLPARRGGAFVPFSKGALAMFGFVGVAVAALLLWPGEPPKSPTAGNDQKPQQPANAQDAIAKPADPKESPFVVQGRITDETGKPLQGVEVGASCGMGSLRETGKATTDADGRYRLPFYGGGSFGGTPLGIGTQVATITPRMKGWYEIHLGRRGNLLMSEYENRDANDTKGYSGVVTPNKPYELNFAMTRGATVKGRLLNEFGSAVARQTIYLTGEVLPPSCGALASFETGEDGRFQFDSVPVWLADPSLKLKWRFSMRVHGVRHELESDSFEVAVADPKAEPESQQLTIDSTSDNKAVRLYLRRKVIPPGR